MKKLSLSLLAIIVLNVSCKTKKTSDVAPKDEIKIDFISKSGSSVSGKATFTQKNGNVTFTAHLTGLTPGVHAIHLHENSDCSAPDGSSAGGHWNPTFKQHGKWGVGEYHKGDIGNFTAEANGNGTITMTTDEWCIGCGDTTKDILGKSLIVHQGTDDFTSQPAGNAGARVACSAVVK